MGTNTIEYLYNATGQKVTKVVTESGIKTQTDYLAGGFQYKNNALLFFPHPEGYVNVIDDKYNYVFNYTDHLGNIRLSYGMDPSTSTLKILEENHYYPFGLKHEGYNMDYKTYQKIQSGAIAIRLAAPLQPNYLYKYNGKELQTELGLNLYDYGARNYDAAIGRWMNMDPLAENFTNISPYIYVANNPIFYKDPDGRDIYRYDEKSGEFILHQSNDDEFDSVGNFAYDKKKKKYILKEDKDGDPKLIIEKIAKKILKDGLNLKNENNVIEVNGNDLPTEQDLINFLVIYSEKLSKVEVSGYGLSNSNYGENNITGFIIWSHKNNKIDKGEDYPYTKNEIIRVSHRLNYMGKSRFAIYHFHTHLDRAANTIHDDIDTPSWEDTNSKVKRGNIPCFIFNSNGKIKY